MRGTPPGNRPDDSKKESGASTSPIRSGSLPPLSFTLPNSNNESAKVNAPTPASPTATNRRSLPPLPVTLSNQHSLNNKVAPLGSSMPLSPLSGSMTYQQHISRSLSTPLSSLPGREPSDRSRFSRSSSVPSSHSVILQKTGSQMRAEAVKEGLPPVQAIVSAISSMIYGNTLTYRSGGEIPEDLYFGLEAGKIEPKNFSAKAKSAKEGEGAGNATLDPRNGRRDFNPVTKQWEFKNKGDAPTGGDITQKEKTLRGIFNDIGIKYALLEGAELNGKTNPDENGMLRYKQINHPDPYVGNIVYGVMTKGADSLTKVQIKSLKLTSSPLKNVAKTPDASSPFANLNLDTLCKVYVKHPDDTKELNDSPLYIQDNIVRDADLDNITDPLQKNLEKQFGKGNFDEYLQFIDTYAEHFNDPVAQAEEDIRADDVTNSMLVMMLELNQKKWDNYELLKNKAEKELSPEAFENWEISNVLLRPILPKIEDSGGITLMAELTNVKGMGTAMQLFQKTELNFLQQRFMSAYINDKVLVADFDNPTARNKAILAIIKEPIDFNKKYGMIQHFAENGNDKPKFVSPRGQIVRVREDNVGVMGDKEQSELALKNKEYIRINPLWIAQDPPTHANSNAEVWVKHFLAQSTTYYAQVKTNVHYAEAVKIGVLVDKYLEKNPGLVEELQKSSKAHPSSENLQATQAYITTFLKSYPDIAEKLAATSGSLESEAKSDKVRPNNYVK